MSDVDRYAKALADAVDAALAGWVVRCVERRALEAGFALDGPLRASAEQAGARAHAEVMPRLRALLEADVDEQRTTPLTLLREAVRFPTEVLRASGVPAVERDDYSRHRFPADDYDLAPATFADIDAAVAEAGLAWGAAKAFAHRQRHGR